LGCCVPSRFRIRRVSGGDFEGDGTLLREAARLDMPHCSLRAQGSGLRQELIEASRGGLDLRLFL
jgi:hypothetical protein